MRRNVKEEKARESRKPRNVCYKNRNSCSLRIGNIECGFCVSSFCPAILLIPILWLIYALNTLPGKLGKAEKKGKVQTTLCDTFPFWGISSFLLCCVAFYLLRTTDREQCTLLDVECWMENGKWRWKRWKL